MSYPALISCSKRYFQPFNNDKINSNTYTKCYMLGGNRRKFKTGWPHSNFLCIGVATLSPIIENIILRSRR